MALRILCSSSSKNAVQIGDILARFMSTGAGSNIGFIGLGNMGGHMANNLIKQVNEYLAYCRLRIIKVYVHFFLKWMDIDNIYIVLFSSLIQVIAKTTTALAIVNVIAINVNYI